MQRMELGQAQDKPLQGNLQEREKFLMQGFMETSSGQGLMDTLITLVYNCELGKGAQLRHVYENTKGKAFFLQAKRENTVCIGQYTVCKDGWGPQILYEYNKIRIWREKGLFGGQNIVRER